MMWTDLRELDKKFAGAFHAPAYQQSTFDMGGLPRFCSLLFTSDERKMEALNCLRR